MLLEKNSEEVSQQRHNNSSTTISATATIIGDFYLSETTQLSNNNIGSDATFGNNSALFSSTMDSSKVDKIVQNASYFLATNRKPDKLHKFRFENLEIPIRVSSHSAFVNHLYYN